MFGCCSLEKPIRGSSMIVSDNYASYRDPHGDAFSRTPSSQSSPQAGAVGQKRPHLTKENSTELFRRETLRLAQSMCNSTLGSEAGQAVEQGLLGTLGPIARNAEALSESSDSSAPKLRKMEGNRTVSSARREQALDPTPIEESCDRKSHSATAPRPPEKVMQQAERVLQQWTAQTTPRPLRQMPDSSDEAQLTTEPVPTGAPTQEEVKAATTIQKLARGFLTRMKAKRHSAAVMIQRHACGLLARRKVRKAKATPSPTTASPKSPPQVEYKGNVSGFLHKSP